MLILFGTACCGVTEEGAIWAVADGETLEVSQELGEEMILIGYGVLAPGSSGAETLKAKKPKKNEA